MSSTKVWPWPHLWPFGTDERPRITEFDGGHWAIAIPAAGPSAFVAPNRDGGAVLVGVDGHYPTQQLVKASGQMRRAVNEVVHRITFDGDEHQQYLEAWRRRFMSDDRVESCNARTNLVYGRGMLGWSLDHLAKYSQQAGVEPVAPVRSETAS
ncbi:hypothetical protein ACT17_14665 [Mycolicibacterium conceptionense]|uniref:Uncharacterized protein n=1 Tax=Mycolicibacterium conceptionense TaxID=451644 RepID=A0A0J8U953_9MYCO|nr:hypothetical protein [Mycolicibacterium conceptionense]KMV17537.1 hypothetical protein ACT17_14665 [Mycolicibacterium conceptionense]